MTTPVYTEFPHRYIVQSGETGKTITIATPSGILHSVVIGKSTTGTVTIADNTTTIMVFGTSTPAGSYIFDCDYAGPLTCATTASDFVCVMAGPV